MTGMVQLSYCAASTRNTNTSDRLKMIGARLPAFSCWKTIPVHSWPYPSGSACSATSSMALTAWPEL